MFRIVDSFQGPNPPSLQTNLSNLRGKKMVGGGQHARISSHGPPQINMPAVSDSHMIFKQSWNLQAPKGQGGLKNLDLDQHFEQFDMEVYNHIAQTKSPVVNNRFFVDNSGAMNIGGASGGNSQLRQVYGVQ